MLLKYIMGGYAGALSATGKTKTVVVSSVFFVIGTVIALSAVGCLSGIVGVIIFGFVLGGATSLGSLCCNPVFPIVLGASFLKGSTLWGLALLFSYALGYGVTIAAGMLGVGLGLGKISKILTKSAVVIKYIGGITLIVLGFYLLITI